MFPLGAVQQGWPIISGYLMDFNSDDVVRAVSRSGLDVDWTITDAQDYSHKTRKRAYGPKIQAAFQALDDRQKQTVFTALATEIMRMHPQNEEIAARLAELNAPTAQAHTVVPVAADDLHRMADDGQPDAPDADQPEPETTVDTKRVFVVHGRDDAVRTGMFDFLRAIGLNPMEWSEAIQLTGKASPYIGEILDVAFDHAQAIVVISTPDDEVRLSNHLVLANDPDDERTFKMQARANVIFEAGMGFGRHPDRTILVEIGRVKAFSDVAGRHVIRLNNTEGKRKDLADRLKTAGCAVVFATEGWKTTGNFVADRIPVGAVAPAQAAAAANTVKYVDLLYPTDSGLRARLGRERYQLRWSNDDQLARRLDLEGWSLATEQDATGKETVLKLRGDGVNQTLIKKRNILAQ